MKHIVTITKSAVCKLVQISKESNKPFLRFYVKGGGCNGFNYKLEPTTDAPEGLDEPVTQHSELKMFVCGTSVMHLLGTKIDWTKDIMGEGFKFDNPMAQSKCGCGTSFSSKAI
jgi:iron-sulfur cluster assembly accessory protein